MSLRDLLNFRIALRLGKRKGFFSQNESIINEALKIQNFSLRIILSFLFSNCGILSRLFNLQQ